MTMIIEILNGDKGNLTRIVEQEIITQVAGDALAVVGVLATEDTVLAAAQHDLESSRMRPTRVLQYARDINDNMRVSVIGGSVNVNGSAVQQYFGSTTNTPPLWHAQGSPGSMDAREQQREMSQQTFNQTRNGRWVFT